MCVIDDTIVITMIEIFDVTEWFNSHLVSISCGVNLVTLDETIDGTNI